MRTYSSVGHSVSDTHAMANLWATVIDDGYGFIFDLWTRMPNVIAETLFFVRLPSVKARLCVGASL